MSSASYRERWERSKKRFQGDIDLFAIKTDKEAERVVRTVAFEVLESISVGSVVGGAHPITGSPGTPVDTSFARNSWWVSFGQPSGAPLQSRDARANEDRGQAMLANAQAALLTLRTGVPVFFLNNAEYILPLEYGHSPQAPAGFIRLTVKAAQALLNHAAKRRSS